MNGRFVTMAAALCCLIAAGCDRLDMYDQPRYEPLESSSYFADGLSARQPVPGTIPRGGLQEDDAYFTGKTSGKLVTVIPEAAYRAVHARAPGRFEKPFGETPSVALRRALLERGQERFNIHCAVCHSRDGDGDGIVVQRGFPKPPTYHSDTLRNAPAGHLFDVITHGSGPMASYASRVNVADRWAIVAWIRVLQFSQHATLDDVPAEHRQPLLAPGPGEAAP